MTVEGVAAVPRAQAFRAIAPIALEKIFRGLGPLPAFTATRKQTGGWDHVGATRVVELADGSEAREQLTAYDEPGDFAYCLNGFTGPLRHLVAHAEGEWWFAEDDAGNTRVRWRYVFQPRAGRHTVTRLAILPLWRRYQRRVLMLALKEAAKAPL